MQPTLVSNQALQQTSNADQNQQATKTTRIKASRCVQVMYPTSIQYTASKCTITACIVFHHELVTQTPTTNIGSIGYAKTFPKNQMQSTSLLKFKVRQVCSVSVASQLSDRLHSSHGYKVSDDIQMMLSLLLKMYVLILKVNVTSK